LETCASAVGGLNGRQSAAAAEVATAAGINCSRINNISEIVTADGKKIVIVITKDSNDKNGNDRNAASPGPSCSTGSSPVRDSDSDWTPNSPPASTSAGGKISSGRQLTKASRRGPYKKSASSYNVRDRKERKKLQNVVAARRYRDKKKSEQASIEDEERELADRNAELRDKLSEMENEVKTLKKLMVELGLVKVSAQTAKALRD